MTPRQLDNTIFVLQVVLPVWIVLRSDWRGIFFGAAIQWGLGVVAGWLSAASDPHRGFNLDALWLLIGLLFCLSFCFIVYAIKRGIGLIVSKPAGGHR
jgi:hypothetical protein